VRVLGSPAELQVSMGDEGLSQCAGKCDTESGCVGYSMTETGMCTMFKAINVSKPTGVASLVIHSPEHDI
jgi:hypothetical protein